MNRRHAIAAATSILAISLAACQPTGQTVSSKPDSTSHAPSKPTPKRAATIGDTITLKGQNGEKIAVTLTEWADPAKSGDSFIGPDHGKRWVAAQFALKNVGKVAYNDSPSNGVEAADAAGEHFDATLATSITEGPLMSSDLKLGAGDKGLGWIVIEVPKAAKVTKVQFTLDSGFGDQTGEWTVK